MQDALQHGTKNVYNVCFVFHSNSKKKNGIAGKLLGCKRNKAEYTFTGTIHFQWELDMSDSERWRLDGILRAKHRQEEWNVPVPG